MRYLVLTVQLSITSERVLISTLIELNIIKTFENLPVELLIRRHIYRALRGGLLHFRIFFFISAAVAEELKDNANSETKDRRECERGKNQFAF